MPLIAMTREMGSLGKHLLRDIPHVIRVRVCAPLETRIARMMERLETDSRSTIVNEIQMSEEAHMAIAKRHFGNQLKAAASAGSRFRREG